MFATSIIVEAIKMTFIGIIIVFGVLALLTSIIYLFPKLAMTRMPVTKKETMITEKGKQVIKQLQSKPSVPSLSSDELLLVSAAVNAYLEYKAIKMREIELFRKLPPLARLLPLIGVKARAKLKISVMGSEKEVIVEDVGIDKYLVKVGSKEYKVGFTTPISKEIVLEI